jgi:hypothetical protein
MPEDGSSMPDVFPGLRRQIDVEAVKKSLRLGEQIIICLMQKHSIVEISALFDIPRGQLYTSVRKIRENVSKLLLNERKMPMLPSPENITAKQISVLPIGDLVQLHSLINKRLIEAKTMKERLDDGLELRFALPLQEEMQNQSKDTGTVYLTEGDFRITAEVPKRVAWDPEKMEKALKLLSENTRQQIVKTSYSIDERLYKDLPPQYREVLDPARTVTPGRPRFKISLPASGERQ